MWLATRPGFPGWKDVRLVEIGRGTRYVRAGDEPYAYHVDETALATPDGYAARFDELLGAGYSWINISCYGLLGETAIVAVELPQRATGVPRGRTSVNLSGPPIDVATGAARWNADGYVVLQHR